MSSEEDDGALDAEMSEAESEKPLVKLATTAKADRSCKAKPAGKPKRAKARADPKAKAQATGPVGTRRQKRKTQKTSEY